MPRRCSSPEHRVGNFSVLCCGQTALSPLTPSIQPPTPLLSMITKETLGDLSPAVHPSMVSLAHRELNASGIVLNDEHVPACPGSFP